MPTLPDSVVRYLRTLAAIEREVVLQPTDAPLWLVGMLGSVDPLELDELVGDKCPTCGREQHSVRADLIRAARKIDTADGRIMDEIRTIS